MPEVRTFSDFCPKTITTLAERFRDTIKEFYSRLMTTTYVSDRHADNAGGGSQHRNVQSGKDAECLPSGAHHRDPGTLKEGLQRPSLLRKQVRCSSSPPFLHQIQSALCHSDGYFEKVAIIANFWWRRRGSNPCGAQLAEA